MSKIIVHNFFGAQKIYPDFDALILSTCEWYDANDSNCQLDVMEDDSVIMLEFIHYGFTDGDATAVIVKAELPDCVDVNDLVQQLESCC